jgi:AraC-like DNA-binding protein
MYNQVSIVRHHIYKATEMGVDFRELCKRLEITPEILADGEAHLPFSPDERKDFWIQAVNMSGNPCLGLHMGQRPDKLNNAFGMLGLLATTCRTAGDAMSKVSRYNDALTNMFRYHLDLSGTNAILEMTPHIYWEETLLESARQAVDMSIAGWLTAINEIAVRPFYPIQLELKYPKRFEAEYRKVANCPVLFNQPVNRFIFRMEDMDTELKNYDQSLLLAFDAMLRGKQQQLESRKTMASQIKQLLLSNFHGQITHIDVVAASLFTTTRTLQRKLAEEQTSYRAICSELRKELAQGLIKVGKHSKTQLAALLGYSDASTFSKALRNWEV